MLTSAPALATVEVMNRFAVNSLLVNFDSFMPCFNCNNLLFKLLIKGKAKHIEKYFIMAVI